MITKINVQYSFLDTQYVLILNIIGNRIVVSPVPIEMDYSNGWNQLHLYNTLK